ncbi:hypothetical protein [Actinoplanes sp. L3-i22]|uniref:hypothetical protein n=1 Tax=Actinoplanes sp. L3-i22 TaxID=2836373 RepID=UPI001C75B731|nr:hypothetical protein [Actinoplanes sp. L3-i22]BCY08704.1 hypothetical protein L3i22_037920 [Actinoplanes sp. L3-i22]
MRSNIIKLAIYLAAVMAILVFLFPVYGEFVRIDEPRRWEAGDGVYLIVPDPLLYSHVEMTFDYVPSSNSDADRDLSGVDNLTISVGGLWNKGVTLPDLPLAFSGQAANLVDECHASLGLGAKIGQRGSRTNEASIVAAASEDPTGQKPVRWLSIRVDDPNSDPLVAGATSATFDAVVECPIRTHEVWRQSSGKLNLYAPPAQVLTLEPIGIGESRAVKRKVGVRHCVSVNYVERPGVVPVYLFPQRLQKEERDRVSWRNCKTNKFAEREDGDFVDTLETVHSVGSNPNVNVYGTQAVAVRVSIEETARQDWLNRNLFLAGIGLGIAGNFLAEAFGLLIAIVEEIAPPTWRKLRVQAFALRSRLHQSLSQAARAFPHRLGSFWRRITSRKKDK